MITKCILRGNEIEFFYNILSQYESEKNHNGYNYSRIDKNLQIEICLKLKTSPITKPKDDNTIYYTGRLKAASLLKHVRNSFAHCNITSDDKENTFSFYDEYNGQCTMYGSMDKILFYKLISVC